MGMPELESCLKVNKNNLSQNSAQLQWVTKKTHLADFENCVFRIYLSKKLELQKSFLHLFASLSEELLDKNFFFQTRSDICKNAVFPEKSKLLEKILYFENIKNFFWWIEGLGIELTYKLFSGSKIITQPLQVKLDVFALFLWIWFSPAVIKMIKKWKNLFYQIYALLKGNTLKRKCIWFVHYCYDSW